ncbi:MAG: hypothetical protein Q4P30_02825 [Eubacteriales bacterium]|nr:hypothetical protein [Eubacteriales bacterium]
MQEMLFFFLFLYALVLLLVRRIANKNVAYIVVDIITVILLFFAPKAYAPVADIDVIGTYFKVCYWLMFLFAVNMVYNIYVLVKRKNDSKT